MQHLEMLYILTGLGFGWALESNRPDADTIPKSFGDAIAGVFAMFLVAIFWPGLLLYCWVESIGEDKKGEEADDTEAWNETDIAEWREQEADDA